MSNDVGLRCTALPLPGILTWPGFFPECSVLWLVDLQQNAHLARGNNVQPTMPDPALENPLASFAVHQLQAGSDLCYFPRLQAVEELTGLHDVIQQDVLSILLCCRRFWCLHGIPRWC